MTQFRLHHIIPLFIATAFTFGGMMPIWNPVGAMREFGLPDHIALSHPAQQVFVVYASRMTAFGFAIYTFYLQGKLKAVDTVLSLMVYVGFVDAYICWQEGSSGTAVFRGIAGIIVGGWGFLGLTSKGS